jgi:5-methylcytosine-specific restriction endonuclease McrA
MRQLVRQYEFGPLVPQGWMTSTQKVRAYMTPHLRGAIIRRDRGLCRYCACRPEVIEIDHVWPVVRGGQSTMENCVTACRSCNQRKGWSTNWKPIPLDEMPWAIEKRAKAEVRKNRRKTKTHRKLVVDGKLVKVPIETIEERAARYGEDRVFRYTGR